MSLEVCNNNHPEICYKRAHSRLDRTCPICELLDEKDDEIKEQSSKIDDLADQIEYLKERIEDMCDIYPQLKL